MVIGTAIAAAEWLHAPSGSWAGIAAATAAVAAALSAVRRRPTAYLLAATLLLLAVALVVTAHRLHLIASDWPEQREERITAYGARVGGELRSALRAATRLADRGAAAAMPAQDPDGACSHSAAAIAVPMTITSHQ
jgi:hypothetical protein